MRDEWIENEQRIYEIKIKGRLEERWAGWFENLGFSYQDDGTTTLRGPLKDQAALQGVLKNIHSLNLELISVQPIKGEVTMSQSSKTVHLILKAVALGMAAAVVVLGILNATTMETSSIMLGLGLFALALSSLQSQRSS
jgi:hypothetical protein